MSRRRRAGSGTVVDDVWLLWRGLWFRRGLSLAVLVVAVLVIGGAVTGPLFLRASGESVLRDQLRQALPAGRMVSDRVFAPVSKRPLLQAQQGSAHKLASRPVLQGLLGSPVGSLEVNTTAGAAGVSGASVSLVYRQGACEHVQMVQGQCAVAPGTVMVSQNTAKLEQWHVGQDLVVGGRPVLVSGTYEPLQPTGDFWAGHPYFAAFSGSGIAGDLGTSLDAVFAPLATVRAQPSYVTATGQVDRFLDLARIRLTDVPTLNQELLSYTEKGATGLRNTGAGDVSDSAIPGVLAEATQIIGTLTLPVVVVEVQLLVLCWLVLFLVVANAAEVRGPEVALAKLRGVPAGRTMAFGLLDTLMLVVVAAPIGFVAAWGWVAAITRWQLAAGTPVVLTTASVLAAVAGTVGALVAAALAGSRTLRRPVVEQWRRATRHARARSWVIDIVVVAATVAGLVVLSGAGATSGSSGPNQWALVVPALVVLVAALLGSRVLPLGCRAAFGPTRRRGWIAAGLASRQLARRPYTLRLALVLAVAFGLVAFAIDAWSVGRSNAHDRAWMEVGAAQVLTVTPPPGQDLASVVDRLDPSGQQAAAVTAATDYGGPTPEFLLAVQPDRFARVAFWRADFGAPSLGAMTQQLTTAVAPTVTLTGDELRVQVMTSKLSGTSSPQLVADIVQPGAMGPTPITLGTVRAGEPGVQVLQAALPCPSSCRLAGLDLERPDADLYPISGRVLLTGMSEHRTTGWRTLPANLNLSHGWRAAGGGAGEPDPTPAGLALPVDAGPADIPTWSVADWPQQLPALVTAPALASGGPQIGGLGSGEFALDPISTGPALPGIGAYGVVVDRDYALRAAGGNTANATETVWLAPTAVAAFPERLKQAGVSILSVSSADDLTAIYQRQGPELALLLFLAGALLGALLAAGGTVLHLHLTGRRRTYEIAAMSAIGLRRRTQLAALYLEQGVLLVFGIGVGVAAGLGAAVLALPAVPEFAETPDAPPLLYGVHLAPVLGSIAVALAVVAAVIAVSSAQLVRRSRYDQLREAPP